MIKFAALVALPLVVLSQAVSYSHSNCPVGWSSYREKCYYIGQGINLSKVDSIKHCSQVGGNLTIPENEGQNNFIKLYLNNLFSTNHEYASIAGSYPSEDLSYVDWVSSFGFDYELLILKTLPTNTTMCIYMVKTTNWQWQVMDCNSHVSTLYVCERDAFY